MKRVEKAEKEEDGEKGMEWNKKKGKKEKPAPVPTVMVVTARENPNGKGKWTRGKKNTTISALCKEIPFAFLRSIKLGLDLVTDGFDVGMEMGNRRY